MVVLQEAAMQDDLLGIAPDFPAMLSTQTNDEIFAVMVTAAAGAVPKQASAVRGATPRRNSDNVLGMLHVWVLPALKFLLLGKY